MNSRLLDHKWLMIVARIEKAWRFISSQNRDGRIICGMAIKAEHDELIGLIYAAMYSDGELYFETSATGMGRENKVFAAGMLTSSNFRLM